MGLIIVETSRRIKLIYVLVGATAVYMFSQWDALTNPYVVGDDVRQQIYWMQKWSDPELFTNDYLTEYAMNYVPSGVKAIYAATHSIVNPLRFSGILSGILFVITAGFIFSLGLRVGDEITAVLTVCFYCLLGHFMENITTGVSRSFAYPLLISYVFFLSGKNLTGAAAVILMASVLNPYIFILCLTTQALFLLHHYWLTVSSRFSFFIRLKNVIRTKFFGTEGLGSPPDSALALVEPQCEKRDHFTNLDAVISFLFAGGACLLFASQYFGVNTTPFGSLVTVGDMIGHAEYSALGRYEIFPQPSFLDEIVRVWFFDLPFRNWGTVTAWFFAIVGMAIIFYAIVRKKLLMDFSIMRTLGYLLLSSFLLYVAARVLLFRLFVPSRYIEFSFNIFFCLFLAKCFRAAMSNWISDRAMFPLLTTLIFILGGGLVYQVGIYDYSNYARIYRFFENTPKNVLIAGHPEVMDDVLTFARRKAFVTYKLSHTWYMSYWKVMKQRTFDFFRAYYSGIPAEIYSFCKKNGIDYMVVRDSDFYNARLTKGGLYFEPFDSFIRSIASSQPNFALLDRGTFPPIFEADGIRVIKVSEEGKNDELVNRMEPLAK